MSSLLPPSPSISPAPNGTVKNARASMGPSRNAQGLSLNSPRPGGMPGSARPTSELLGTGGLHQTPEAEALDQWFENLQNYEVTLEEMAAASLDVNFKEELSAIEQWFKVLSEAERTAALYSLLQHSTQVQIRFFITVLQQMSKSDPMTALLSPAVGGSMQSQMEAKLASLNLKSPGFAPSPTARNFSMGSARGPSSDSFLSPDTAHLAPGEASGTLAQQRAKLRASNAAHRISAPVAFGGDGRTTWGSGAPQLSQVDERSSSPGQEFSVPQVANTRPKSTDFSGAANAFRPRAGSDLDNAESWANMVSTPLNTMFGNKVSDAAVKQPDWSSAPHVPLLEDPKKFRRVSKANSAADGGNQAQSTGDEGSWNSGGQRPGGFRNASGNTNNGIGPAPAVWNNNRGQGPSPGSARYPEDSGLNSGVGLNGFNMGMGSAGLSMGLPSASVLAGMPMSPFGMNMNMLNMAAMGMSPEAAQLLAAQMAAAGQFTPGFSPGGVSLGMAMQQQQQQAANQRSAARSVRSPGAKSSVSGRGDKGGEEEIDLKVLEDVPAWLRLLRLHKYTPNFEGMTWKDMVILDESQLEAKGVAALGARRKMLKTFEAVRAKYGMEVPAGSTTTTTSA